MGHDAGVGGHGGAPDTVRVERMKWPDRAHAQMSGRMLGHDEHGAWIGLPDLDEVWCVPEDRWWVACWFARADAVAVDIAMPAAWHDGAVRLVGLDFRVIAKSGEPRLVGDDDFEENRLAFEYPSSVVAKARVAAAEVLAAMEAREPPFTWEVGAGWLSILRAV